MKRTTLPLLPIAALLMTACAAKPPRSLAAVPLVPTQPRLLSHLTLPAEPDYLALAGRYRAMSATEQASEAEALDKAYSAAHVESTRLQLALLLTLAQPPVADRARAVSLLDLPPGEANGRGRLHPLAQLLLPMLHELRKLDEALLAMQQKLREQQQANEAMHQKLEALREIELRLQERPMTP